MILKLTVYHGNFVDTPSLGDVRIRPQTTIGVGTDGKILFIKEKSQDPLRDALDFDQTLQPSEVAVVKISGSQDGSFFFPGFVDTHVHASQYPNAGIFGSSTLLDWLQTYTFPLEASLKDADTARAVYNRVLDRTLANGTTTASYYTTIDAASSNLMARICAEKGQRAFIGKVCMDQNSPDYYVESFKECKHSTRQVVDYIKKELKDEKIQPVLTPRFAPSCSRKLMSWLGQLAHEEDLNVQTHLSENLAELELVAELFPECENYSQVYDNHHLLTKKTLLAHCVHLSDKEIELLKLRGCGVSHCPISNSSLASGECRVRLLLDNGINVGLGTDLSGGYSSSILAVARQALLVSRHLAMKETDAKKQEHVNLSVEDVLFLASLGGAQALSLGSVVGSFEVNKQFDAQLINLDPVSSNVDVFEWQRTSWNDSPKEGENQKLARNLLAKWLFTGDDRNTARVWVAGRLVHSYPASAT